MNIFKNVVAAWAVVIIVGGLMITPGGIVPIVTLGWISVVVGIAGVAVNLLRR